MMDLATARRCVEACAEYLRQRDDSPRAARDLRQAVKVIETEAAKHDMSTCPLNFYKHLDRQEREDQGR